MSRARATSSSRAACRPTWRWMSQTSARSFPPDSRSPTLSGSSSGTAWTSAGQGPLLYKHGPPVGRGGDGGSTHDRDAIAPACPQVSQCFGGFIGTNVHHSYTPTAFDWVEALWLAVYIGGEPQIVRASRNERRDLFESAFGICGITGIIVKVRRWRLRGESHSAA